MKQLTNSFILSFFYCGKVHNIKFIILTILSTSLSGVKHVHIAGQPSPPTTSRLSSSPYLSLPETLYSLSMNFPFLFHTHPQTLATTTLLSVCMSLTTLRASYKWDDRVVILCVWLISVSVSLACIRILFLL